MASMSILKYMCPLKEKPDLPDPTGPLGEKGTLQGNSCQSPRGSTGKEKPPKPWIIYIPDISPEVRI